MAYILHCHKEPAQRHSKTEAKVRRKAMKRRRQVTLGTGGKVNSICMFHLVDSGLDTGKGVYFGQRVANEKGTETKVEAMFNLATQETE
jgi:hypothetical protein